MFVISLFLTNFLVFCLCKQQFTTVLTPLYPKNPPQPPLQKHNGTITRIQWGKHMDFNAIAMQIEFDDGDKLDLGHMYRTTENCSVVELNTNLNEKVIALDFWGGLCDEGKECHNNFTRGIAFKTNLGNRFSCVAREDVSERYSYDGYEQLGEENEVRLVGFQGFSGYILDGLQFQFEYLIDTPSPTAKTENPTTSKPTGNTNLPTVTPTQITPAPTDNPIIPYVDCITDICTQPMLTVNELSKVNSTITITTDILPSQYDTTDLIYFDAIVSVNGNHTQNGDLIITLVKDGNSVSLVRSFSTFSFADDFNITFSDNADSNLRFNEDLNCGCTRKPSQPLDSLKFFDANILGDWVLIVEDDVNGGSGVFKEWCLKKLCYVFTTTSPTRNPSNRPSVPPTKKPSDEPSLSPTKDPTFSPVVSQCIDTNICTTPNQVISNTEISSKIQITQEYFGNLLNVKFVDMIVSTKGSHSWNGDLKFSLLNEENNISIILLPSDLSSSSEDDFNIIFDDNSNIALGINDINCNCSRKPFESFKAFIGINLLTNFTFIIEDTYPRSEIGYWNEWCIKKLCFSFDSLSPTMTPIKATQNVSKNKNNNSNESTYITVIVVLCIVFIIAIVIVSYFVYTYRRKYLTKGTSKVEFGKLDSTAGEDMDDT